jgi:hypothetical protein
MSIRKLDLNSSIEIFQRECDTIINSVGWGNTHQIGLKSKPNSDNLWFDSTGSLYDRGTKSFTNNELDFNVWNLDSNNYIRQEVEKLQEKEKIIIGRVRIMKLLPKIGLSVHKDNEFRYHLVLKTNPSAYFAFNETISPLDSGVTEMGKFYHIPKDGFWYFVDTTKIHWVYNGGKEDRIHIVVCGIK